MIFSKSERLGGNQSNATVFITFPRKITMSTQRGKNKPQKVGYNVIIAVRKKGNREKICWRDHSSLAIDTWPGRCSYFCCEHGRPGLVASKEVAMRGSC